MATRNLPPQLRQTPLTADTALTLITDAATDDAACDVMLGLPLATLRAVADLCYAVDYPDMAGRATLTRAIVEAAR